MKKNKIFEFLLEYARLYYMRYLIGIMGVFLLCVLFSWELILDPTIHSMVYVYDTAFVVFGYGIPAIYFLGGLSATCFFLEERRYRSVNNQILRNGREVYLLQRSVLTGVSSFVSIFLGLSLYVLLLCGLALHYKIPVVTEGDLYYLHGHPWIFLLLRNITFSLCGVMWSMLALFVSSFSVNYYVVFTIPFAAYFFMERMALYLPDYFDLYNLTLGYELGSLVFPFNYIYILTEMLFLSMLFSQLFRWRGRSLIENGKIS